MPRASALAGILLAVLAACSNPTDPAAEPARPAQPASPTPTPTPTVPSLLPPAAVPAGTLAPGIREADPTALALAREYTDRFYRGQIDLLYDEFTPGLREVLSLEQLSTLHEHVGTNFGKETGVLAEDAQSNEEYRAFVRWARFDKTDEVIEIRWTLRRDDNSVAEFWIRPAAGKDAGGS